MDLLLKDLPQDTKFIWQKYDEGFQFTQDKKKRQVNQLILLNNLQRGDENIASTMLLTLFDRILSANYDDKMQVKFIPGEEIDQKKVNSLNILAQNDYREMDKERLDYDWMWDTLFFGRGYCETYDFDRKRKLLKPSIINPLAFGYDPYFDNTQDWRYYWKWITKNKWQLNQLIKKGVITGITDTSQIPSGIEAYLWDYKIRREEARKATPQSNDVQSNDVFQILEYYGYDKDGDKACFWIDKGFSKILYHEKLDLRDGPDKSSEWPIVVKEAFREPHSSVNFSVVDLLEDKHRATSVLLNLAFIAAKDQANPLYGYNPDKVRDVSQLLSRQINQHIPMDEEGAMWPLNSRDSMPAGLQVFMLALEKEANAVLGTGIPQPMSGKKGKETATQAAVQQQLNDLARSLQAKVLQFGEKEFWSKWYQRYRRFTKAGDEKIATIVGVKGMTFEKIDLGDIHTKFPPGVMILSTKDAEYKEMVLRRDLMQMYPQFQQTFDKDAMRNFNKYVFLPKFLEDPQIMDILMPKTTDEIKAEEENDAIDIDKMPPVSPTDNHEQHLAVHYMAKPTWSKWVHIAWHEALLAEQKSQQMQAAQPGQPQPDQQGQPGQDAQKPEIGAQKKDAKENAVPLKAELSGKTK